MSENVIQASFAAGELSPSLFARVDFAKYRSGAATMRNFFVDYRSGASTRTGTEYIRPTAGPKVRLVRFQQSQKVSYVLEFGHGYLRFITQGGSVVEPAKGISVVTTGAQTTITAPGHGYTNNQLVFIAGGNIPQLNGRYFLVNNATANTFDIIDPTSAAPINSSAWPVYTGGAVAQRVYTIGTPYTANELSLLKFSQNTNTMNITHPDHPPHKLTLINATNWVLQQDVIGATVPATASTVVTPSQAGTVQYKYAVTAVDDNDQEGLPGPVAITTTGVDLRTTAGTNLVQWNPVPGAVAYNIYGSPASYQPLAADYGGMGFVGSVPQGVFSFYDSNIAADFSQTPPQHDDPFIATGVHPQVSSYFQQRLVFGNGGGNLVQTFWASKTGAPYNFDFSNPTQANDAINGALVSLEVNEIKSMVPMPTGLILLTTNGAWLLSGGAGGVASQGGVLTPATATATPQAYVGANDVPPILINYDIIFVQAKGSIVRDLTYNIYANIYTGNDISIMSSHLFYGHQVVEWAYAEEPFKMVWVVREDGTLLSLTLVKEQDMYGWAHHDTRGDFESVCCVTEGHTDATYFAVRRPHPQNPDAKVLLIERLAEREFPFGAEDAWCVDCGAKTVANTPPYTLQPINIAGTNKVALFVTTGIWAVGHIGWIVRVGGGIVKVTDFVSTFELLGEVLQPITDVIPNDPFKRYKIADPGEWSIDQPFTTVYGLDHLEGQAVSVLADGGVINGLTVHSGSITLPAPATKVVAGYGFQAQLQTMPLDLGQEVNSVQGKRKKIGALTVRCKDSRGIKAGRLFSTVTPIKELNRVTTMGFPIKLVTADERIVMDPLWDVPGQICLQVDDPVPATVLGVVPEVVVGDSDK